MFIGGFILVERFQVVFFPQIFDLIDSIVLR